MLSKLNTYRIFLLCRLDSCCNKRLCKDQRIHKFRSRTNPKRSRIHTSCRSIAADIGALKRYMVRLTCKFRGLCAGNCIGISYVAIAIPYRIVPWYRLCSCHNERLCMDQRIHRFHSRTSPKHSRIHNSFRSISTDIDALQKKNAVNCTCRRGLSRQFFFFLYFQFYVL